MFNKKIMFRFPLNKLNMIFLFSLFLEHVLLEAISSKGKLQALSPQFKGKLQALSPASSLTCKLSQRAASSLTCKLSHLKESCKLSHLVSCKLSHLNLFRSLFQTQTTSKLSHDHLYLGFSAIPTDGISSLACVNTFF
jgi:hypothetical protein